MSNRIDKPKLKSEDIVKKMKEEKGITFEYISENEAVSYLRNVNNYMRTASYRKNYTKIQGGVNNGKYERLDFAYLKELSTIDMHLRVIISKMCSDIEHALKVNLLKDLESNTNSDGYEIVARFLADNSPILSSLETKCTSAFTGDLIEKYFIVEDYIDESTQKHNYRITKYDDCPAWVLAELLSYGEFIRFYNFYYDNNTPIKSNLLHLVRSLRNAVAHNNCLISNLNKNTSRAPREIKEKIQKIEGITKSQRVANQNKRPLLEFTVMLYVYDLVVTDKIKKHQLEKLNDLFKNQMLLHKEFFEHNNLIKSSYNFACCIIDNIFY